MGSFNNLTPLLNKVDVAYEVLTFYDISIKILITS